MADLYWLYIYGIIGAVFALATLIGELCYMIYKLRTDPDNYLINCMYYADAAGMAAGNLCFCLYMGVLWPFAIPTWITYAIINCWYNDYRKRREKAQAAEKQSRTDGKYEQPREQAVAEIV